MFHGLIDKQTSLTLNLSRKGQLHLPTDNNCYAYNTFIFIISSIFSIYSVVSKAVLCDSLHICYVYYQE